MYPFNRFLGVSNSVTLDGIDQLRFENSSITIHNLNIDNVNNLNSVNGGDGTIEYLMAGDGKHAGLASYTTNKASPESANMCENYESQNVANYKETFGVIDFEEAEGGTGKFQASNGIVAPYFAAVSDARAKSDIEPIESALDKIMRLRGYQYTLQATGQKSAGSWPRRCCRLCRRRSWCRKRAKKRMAVNYNALIPLLLEGMKELKELQQQQKTK